MRDQLNNLTFGNAADLVQVQPALALDFLRIFRGTKKGVGDHADGGNSSTAHSQHEFPIRRYCIQREGSVICVGPVVTTGQLKPSRYTGRFWLRNPTDAILPKEDDVDYCACGACTGLRNTPIPATLTSATSPATSGPTPAGVPVAIMSPG